VLKKLTDNTDGLCGVNPFVTTEDDPFCKCCRWHDSAYDNTPANESTKEIDMIFYMCCLTVARKDKPLQIRAKVYYFLARTYGKIRYALGKLGIVRYGRTS
jgi:hypothetical protein